VNRRRFLKFTAGSALAAGTAGAGGLFYGMRLETEWLETTRVEIPVPELGPGMDGLRVALIGDFHLYPHTRLEFIRQVVEEAIRLKPDLVVLAGDFVQGEVEAIWDLAPELGRIDSALGSFAVLGNHDHWKGPDVVALGLRKSGIQVLHNTGLPIHFQGTELFLAGVDDAWSGRSGQDSFRAVPVLSTAGEEIRYGAVSSETGLSLHEPGDRCYGSDPDQLPARIDGNRADPRLN